MAPRKMNNRLRSLLAGCAAVLLFCGCAAQPALVSEITTKPATPAPATLTQGGQKALDGFCDKWNEIIVTEAESGDQAEAMSLEPDDAYLSEEEAPMPEGTVGCSFRVARSTVIVYILNDEIIAADTNSLTRDWKIGGSSRIDPAAGAEWQVCWKTMVLSLNDNREQPAYSSLLADIQNGMPKPADRETSQLGAVVSERGWEYRMASLERNNGVLYDKRVRGCDQEYIDDLGEWMNWM